MDSIDSPRMIQSPKKLPGDFAGGKSQQMATRFGFVPCSIGFWVKFRAISLNHVLRKAQSCASRKQQKERRARMLGGRIEEDRR